MYPDLSTDSSILVFSRHFKKTILELETTDEHRAVLGGSTCSTQLVFSNHVDTSLSVDFIVLSMFGWCSV